MIVSYRGLDARQLIELGYFKTSHTLLLEQSVKKLQQAWANFCSLDLCQKERHVFGGTLGTGYKYFGPEERDYKEFFHLSADYAFEGDNPIEKEFLLLGKHFIQNTLEHIAYVLDVFENATGQDFSEFFEQIKRQLVVRFLHYPARSYVQNALLAAPHVDKGITLHWYESQPGLQILWEEKWVDVEYDEGTFFGYPGLLGQYYGHTTPALTHRVKATPAIAKQGRFSIVEFIDFGNVYYDKATHGPTQERFPAGENYGMPHDVFAKFFIESVRADRLL